MKDADLRIGRCLRRQRHEHGEKQEGTHNGHRPPDAKVMSTASFGWPEEPNLARRSPGRREERWRHLPFFGFFDVAVSACSVSAAVGQMNGSARETRSQRVA